MSDPQDISEDEALAAEYVLRLLDAEAEQAFAARLRDDPGLQARVHAWEASFADMAADLPEVAPPKSAKASLMRKIDPPAPARRWGLGWLFAPTLGALAIVLALVVLPVLRTPGFDPAFHASLASEDGSVRIEAGYAPDGMLFKVIREAGAPAPGRDFELWVIGPEASAPVSLGVVPAERETTFEIPADIAALIDGGTLAISNEPEGGSPTGAPTGEILAAGGFFDV